MKNKKGFTLIELLVVIAIIALLLSILLPSLRTAKSIAKRVVCATNLKSSGAGFHAFAAENNGEIPMTFYAMPRKDGNSGLFYTNMDMPYRAFRAMEVDSSVLQYPDNVKRWTSNHAGWNLVGKKMVWGYGSLFDAGIIENPKTFYCSAAARSDQKAYQYESFSQGHSWPSANPDFAGTSRESNILTGYYYVPQAARKKMRVTSGSLASVDVPAMAIKSSSLTANYLISMDMLATNFVTHEINKNKRGVNALYGDGSVSFNQSKEVFGHSLWDGTFNVNNDASLFRAIIMGIEGKTSYMDLF